MNAHIVVVPATMNGVISVETPVVHPTVQDRAIDSNMVVTVVYVYVCPVNAGAIAMHPTRSGRPAVIVDTAMVPVEVIVQPGTDGQSNGGIETAGKCAKKIAANKSGSFSGDGGKNHLKNLYEHEGKRCAGTKRTDIGGHFFTVGHQIIESRQTGQNGISKPIDNE